MQGSAVIGTVWATVADTLGSAVADSRIDGRPVGTVVGQCGDWTARIEAGSFQIDPGSVHIGRWSDDVGQRSAALGILWQCDGATARI